MSAPDLSALVSARLCHDLISPMGAIGNGLELMQLSSAAGSGELDLVAGSLDSALAKLRFFRLAFGPTDEIGRVRIGEVVGVTEAMFAGRFTASWDTSPAETGARDATRATVKLALLALLCLERSLPLGGAARVRLDGEAVSITVESRRAAPPGALWALASGDGAAEGLRPDGVQFALLARALAEAGRRLDVAFGDAGAALGITAPAEAPPEAPPDAPRR